MSDLFEFLKVIVPTIVVLLVIYFMLRAFSRNNSKQLDYMGEEQKIIKLKLFADRKAEHDKVGLPLKFQAYERMSMFLERVNPPNMVTRVLKPGANVALLHASLLATIRDEYEHNMSQQLYISDTAWTLVKAAKEDVVRLININASKFKPDDDAGKYAQSIVADGFNSGHNSISKAIAALKSDIRNNFA